jgi:hypothetical protein
MPPDQRLNALLSPKYAVLPPPSTTLGTAAAPLPLPASATYSAPSGPKARPRGVAAHHLADDVAVAVGGLSGQRWADTGNRQQLATGSDHVSMDQHVGLLCARLLQRDGATNTPVARALIR